MSTVTIQKAATGAQESLPVFSEMEKRVEAIRTKAWELFERRGLELGRDLEDWLRAERETLGWPAAEMEETGDKYEIKVTLPGFEAKEVQVTAAPGEVIVHAASTHEEKGEKGKVVWTEFGSNDVYRRFEMPQNIDTEKTSANLDNGILKITTAKLAQPAARQMAAAA